MVYNNTGSNPVLTTKIKTNNNQQKQINMIKKTIDAVIAIACIIVIGIVLPLLISVAVCCLTDVTMIECTSSTPFWVGFVGMCFFGTIYLSVE